MLKKVFTEGLVQIAILLSLLRTDLDSLISRGSHRNHDDYPEIQEIVFGQTIGLTQSANIYNDLNNVNRFHSYSSPKYVDDFNDNWILRDIRALTWQRFGNMAADTDVVVNTWLVSDNLRNNPFYRGEATSPTGTADNSGVNDDSASGSIAPPGETNSDGEVPCNSLQSMNNNDNDFENLEHFKEASSSLHDQNQDRNPTDSDGDLEARYSEDNQALLLEEVEPHIGDTLSLDEAMKILEDFSDESGIGRASSSDSASVTSISSDDSHNDRWHPTAPGIPADFLSAPQSDHSFQRWSDDFAETAGDARITQSRTSHIRNWLENGSTPALPGGNDVRNELESGALMLNSYNIQHDDLRTSRPVLERLTSLDNIPIANLTLPGLSRQNSLEPWLDMQGLINNLTENNISQDSMTSLFTSNDMQPTPNDELRLGSVRTGIIETNSTMLASPVDAPFEFDCDDDMLFPNVSRVVEEDESLRQLLDSANMDILNMQDEFGTPEDGVGVSNETSSDSAVSVSSVSPQRDFNETCAFVPPDHSSSVAFAGIEGATGGDDPATSSKRSTKANYEYYDSDDSFNEYGCDNNDLYVNDSSSSNHSDSASTPCASSANLQHVAHNHTYPTPPGQQPREVKAYLPKIVKDPALRFTRDEKRAKQMKLPVTVEQIIYLPVEELNALLETHALTDQQMQLVKDIRRRGKNKVAAQNCRKRKLDEISQLDINVQKLMKNRAKIYNERETLQKEIAEIQSKISHMYDEALSSLRDADGRPYDPSRYRLEFLPDGEPVLVPLEYSSSGQTNDTMSPGESSNSDRPSTSGYARKSKKKK
ncbi:uncharacterized protein LOC141906803 [Tubulanus polymorphus]|uniref:uncharacterized protein LOC141906803 n=1 Tax=Tubulanus polymorphus TaxID=672921 RepID=UPI003DA6B920